ncbi:Rne/Rng family ribonuclease [Brevibacillus borstelensis]|uniref:Rne/Rng family ribonuclease n=1 Tax=Brevibacillus borstelensis TaxID=45462 RepID=UPI002E1F1D79|nr:Rne/Rng family ribonuclease [Brevibacillus borstelensis]MED1852055.1 Rne/Rng family ribonuclease [Brevibacillus borstelensis]
MKSAGISNAGGQLRIALMNKGKLVEWRTQAEASEALSGDIYYGKVAKVVPGIQSAFIDIGYDQQAFLYVDEAAPISGKKAGRSISAYVREGESLLVQVIKEGTETKAPRVTARVSQQGRLLVYLPAEGLGAGEEPVSVSRKIRNECARERLTTLMSSLLEKGEGVIVRTEAAEADEEQLRREWAYLRGRWRDAWQAVQGKKAPCRLLLDDSLIEAALRDFLADGAEEVIVEDAALFRKVGKLMEAMFPEELPKLRWHRQKEPLFAQWGVREQLALALQRQVPLAGGGNIVIDRTEALTVIDVNTGAFSGRGGQQREQAVTAANLEAADEIARQLRLRDIGGMIIVDFINMREEKNRERVFKALESALKADPVPVSVLGMTSLGLVEMTRKRTRASLAERLTEPCPCCEGGGRMLKIEECFRYLRVDLEALAKVQDAEAALVELSDRLFEYWQNGQADGSAWPVTLYVRKAEELSGGRYRILYAGSRQEAERLWLSHAKNS